MFVGERDALCFVRAERPVGEAAGERRVAGGAERDDQEDGQLYAVAVEECAVIALSVLFPELPEVRAWSLT
ncbi:hypothetical protein GCM10027088_35370 [Nocardia goodfellowii]